MSGFAGDISTSTIQTPGIATQTQILSPRQEIIKQFEDPVVAEVMIEIAKCESHLNHFDLDDSTIKTHLNKDGTTDYGVMQINSTHLPEAEKQGINIKTIRGNITFAKRLSDSEGFIKPWRSSFFCWSKTQAYENYREKINKEKELAIAIKY